MGEGVYRDIQAGRSPFAVGSVSRGVAQGVAAKTGRSTIRKVGRTLERVAGPGALLTLGTVAAALALGEAAQRKFFKSRQRAIDLAGDEYRANREAFLNLRTFRKGEARRLDPDLERALAAEYRDQLAKIERLYSRGRETKFSED